MLSVLPVSSPTWAMFVIRPSRPLAVGRYSQDRAELERLYQNGWADAEARADELRGFLSP